MRRWKGRDSRFVVIAGLAQCGFLLVLSAAAIVFSRIGVKSILGATLIGLLALLLVTPPIFMAVLPQPRDGAPHSRDFLISASKDAGMDISSVLRWRRGLLVAGVVGWLLFVLLWLGDLVSKLVAGQL